MMPLNMKSKMSEGNHKVFFWTYENRCRPDATRSIQIHAFSLGPQALSFLFVLAGNMQSKVFLEEKERTLMKQGSPVCLNRRRECSGEDVISKKMASKVEEP